MKRKTIIIILFLTVSHFCSFAQQTAWRKTANWTIYDIQGRNGWQVPIDSLRFFRHKSLNPDSMQRFLAHTNLIIMEEAPVWMGAHFASCILNNKMHKLEISTYGGFFYDETDKKYYELSVDLRNDWLGYLAESGASLQSTGKPK
jgi:hypothetical protein